MSCNVCFVFFFKQKTAYEMRISDWSSDVCSSDLAGVPRPPRDRGQRTLDAFAEPACRGASGVRQLVRRLRGGARPRQARRAAGVGGRAGPAAGAGEPTPRPNRESGVYGKRFAVSVDLGSSRNHNKTTTIIQHSKHINKY